MGHLRVVVVVVSHVTTGGQTGVGAEAAVQAQPGVVKKVALHPFEPST